MIDQLYEPLWNVYTFKENSCKAVRETRSENFCNMVEARTVSRAEQAASEKDSVTESQRVFRPGLRFGPGTQTLDKELISKRMYLRTWKDRKCSQLARHLDTASHAPPKL